MLQCKHALDETVGGSDQAPSLAKVLLTLFYLTRPYLFGKGKVNNSTAWQLNTNTVVMTFKISTESVIRVLWISHLQIVQDCVKNR